MKARRSTIDDLLMLQGRLLREVDALQAEFDRRVEALRTQHELALADVHARRVATLAAIGTLAVEAGWWQATQRGAGQEAT